MNVLKDFRDFILRGNVLDLAIAVIIGVAFGAVVTSLVKDILTPIIGIFGKFSFPDLTLTVNGSKFLIGDFINTVISFLIIALVLFFLVVRPLARFSEPTRKCPYCKSSISPDATKCAYCTSMLTYD